MWKIYKFGITVLFIGGSILLSKLFTGFCNQDDLDELREKTYKDLMKNSLEGKRDGRNQ